MKPPVLYISYDGMLEPLGQSQVLAYLELLSTRYAIHLISFEKAEDWHQGSAPAVTQRIRDAGIAWRPLRYHKQPTAPATALDIALGTALAIRLIRRHEIKLIHARSYVAGIMGMAAKRVTKARFLFDMRGFWADERVDGGLWPARGRLFRWAKKAEQRLLQRADHVVSLTAAAAREISQFTYLLGRVPPISVIPTCADLSRFSPAPTPRPQQPFTMGYVGSVGTWYLFDEVLACFRLIDQRIDGAKMLIVNRGEHDFIRSRLGTFNIAPERYELLSASHEQVPDLIRRMTVGAALIKPAYSKIASAPTKLAEYLGCGVPCLGNARVGDMEEMLEGGRVGISLPGLSRQNLEDGIERLLLLIQDAGLAGRCIAFAHDHFSLNKGVDEYTKIYTRLLSAR